MSFTSIPFIIFVFITLAFYYIFKTRQREILLLASIFFYCCAGPRYIIYILASTLVTYFCACFISGIYSSQEGLAALPAAEQKTRKAQDKERAKRVLLLDLSFVLGILVVLKYFNFTSRNLFGFLELFHIEKDPVLLNFVLPLGLSYFTFMNIGYILDVYWKKIPAEKQFTRFALFSIYFPHVVQGPISRYGQLAPQFSAPKAFDYDRLCSGLQLALWGYFKKMVVADRLGIFVSQVYDNYQNYYGVIFTVATVFYSIQIYADFSGYMDIVRGVSETFGISLAKNFDHPYFSRTIPEFWRRWHMTLGAWFKDYVYYPVSISSWMKKSSKHIRQKYGAQKGRIYMSCIPTLIVWLLTGLWHGAAWNFVLWGAFHALLMVSGIIAADFIQKLTQSFHIDTGTYSWRIFQMLRTFILCCIGRVFFRAQSISAAFSIFQRTVIRPSIWVLFDGSLFGFGLDMPNFILAILSIAVLLIVSILQERMGLRKAFSRQNIIFRWLILYTAIFSILIFGIYGPGYDASAFIYNNF